MIKPLYLLNDLNENLCSLEVDLVDYKNISTESISKMGLHLNP